MRLWKVLLIGFAAVAVALSLLNASWLAGATPGALTLVARHGLAQPVRADAAGPCPAVHLAEEPRPLIENSVQSMREAVRLGARALALDVRRTADGRLVVFRDETVDCRTNGSGRIGDLTLAQLRALDIGHGYTADGGETFPLRGRGVGAMPTVEDVLYAFRNERLIFLLRDSDPAAAEAMAAALRQTGTRVDERIGFFGAPPVLARIEALAPGAWTFDREASEACLAAYRRIGWTSMVPEECAGRMVALTLDADWRLWGWPYRFYGRMAGADAEVMTVSGFGPDGMPIGLTRPEQLGQVPRGFRGWLWVEDMATVGRALVR